MALSTFDINIKAEYYGINILARDALPAQYNALVIVCAYLSVRPFVCSSHLMIVSKMTYGVLSGTLNLTITTGV